jgi:hypothetical protein
MVFVYYTIAGITLYLVSDWILNRIEISRGKRFEYRSIIFFAIIMVLAVGSFEIIDRLINQ